MVHQCIDQEDAATAWLEDIPGIQRIGNGTGIDAGAGIPNDDDHFAGLVTAHRALHVLADVTAAPMADRVGDGFLKRELDRQNVLLRPAFFSSTSTTPSVTMGITAGAAGIVIVNWHVEQKGRSALSRRRFLCAARSCA